MLTEVWWRKNNLMMTNKNCGYLDFSSKAYHFKDKSHDFHRLKYWLDLFYYVMLYLWTFNTSLEIHFHLLISDNKAKVFLCVCVQSFSCMQLLAAPLTVARQAPLSMEFSRQENWRELPFPTPGYLPHPGMELISLVSSALAGGFFTTRLPGKSKSFLK